MSKHIKYSFIIPHKNTPVLLQRCIDSIPVRDDIEVIVVDDNSDSEIVDFNSFPGRERKDVTTILTKEGKGAGYARNIGLTKAIGKWCLFADADDFYADNFISVLDNELDDKIDILYFNVFSPYTPASGRTKRTQRFYSLYVSSQDQNLIKYCIWTPWNKVISRDLIMRSNLCFDETPIGNDAMFALKASDAAKNVKIILDQLYCLTDQPDSITFRKRNINRKIQLLGINLQINSFLENKGLGLFRIDITSIHSYIGMILKDGKDNARKFRKIINQTTSFRRELFMGTIAPIRRRIAYFRYSLK
jgi:glycosyltransferase involved in cell wall biosynthesis